MAHNDQNSRINIQLQTKLEEELRNKLPEFQRRSDLPIGDYVDTTGNILDEFRTTIRALSGYLNWTDAPLDRINQLAASFGFNFPRNLDEQTRRTIVRDIFNIYKRNGTPDTFRWIFKIVGWDVTLQYAWILNPDDLLRGKRDVIYNGEYTYNGDINYDRRNNVDLENFSYQDFVFGEAQVDEDGTFFYGKNYFDNENDPNYVQRYQKVPIQGEYYPNYRFEEGDPYVAASPYLIVRITTQEYRLFTEDYTEIDPDTGEEVTYSYTDSERFAIAEELINFLLFERGRPLQVRVIVIVTDDLYTEELDRVQSDLTQEFTGWSDEYMDEARRVLFFDEPDKFDLTNAFRFNYGFTIGGDLVYPISRFSGLEAPNINDAEIETLEPAVNLFKQGGRVFNVYVDDLPASGSVQGGEFTIRYDSTLDITVPSGFEMTIYGKDNVLDSSFVTHGTYPAGAVSETFTQYHVLKLELTNLGGGTPQNLVGTITLNTIP